MAKISGKQNKNLFHFVVLESRAFTKALVRRSSVTLLVSEHNLNLSVLFRNVLIIFVISQCGTDFGT